MMSDGLTRRFVLEERKYGSGQFIQTDREVGQNEVFSRRTFLNVQILVQ